MRAHLLRPAGLAGGLFVCIAAANLVAEPKPEPVRSPEYPAARAEGVATAKVLGWPSCNSASCHGDDGPKGAAGSEHQTWAGYDPHRRQFSVLFNDRSVRMVRLMAEGTGVKVTAAHRNELCLACHGAAPPNLDGPVPALNEVHRTGGCENCHGAGEKYVHLHYTRPWKALSDDQKAAYGLVPTKNLVARTKMCAGCHVGEPGREVDHRLIAAGHPALRWELTSYQVEPVYSRHWREKAYGPDFEGWAWAIGQVTTARAAADLLRHRAAQAADDEELGKPGKYRRDWPELSEYTCFSCHQGLTGQSASVDPEGRPVRRANAPKLGRLPWGSWLYPLALDLGTKDAPDWARPGREPTALFRLADLFRATDTPRPAEARDRAAAAVAELDRWANALQARAGQRSARAPLRPADLRAALAHTAKYAGNVPRTDAPSTDWDRYTQGFLATTALYRALVGVDPYARDGVAEGSLRAIADGLRFPPGVDGPRRLPAAERDRFGRLWADLPARLNGGERP